MKDYLTILEASKELGLTRHAIHKKIRSPYSALKNIKKCTCGKSILVSSSEVNSEKKVNYV